MAAKHITGTAAELAGKIVINGKVPTAGELSILTSFNLVEVIGTSEKTGRGKKPNILKLPTNGRVKVEVVENDGTHVRKTRASNKASSAAAEGGQDATADVSQTDGQDAGEASAEQQAAA